MFQIEETSGLLRNCQQELALVLQRCSWCTLDRPPNLYVATYELYTAVHVLSMKGQLQYSVSRQICSMKKQQPT